jgi:hypothetical protein
MDATMRLAIKQSRGPQHSCQMAGLPLVAIQGLDVPVRADGGRAATAFDTFF